MENKKTFEGLGLSNKALDAINKKGFEEPTAIQTIVIPTLLRDDTNIIAQAQTGTGKTAAFGLPLIEMVDEKSKSVQALILTPTRELAIQVSTEINSLKGNKNIKTIPIYGGQSIVQQLQRLKKGIHIVVGTPGRIIDHLKRKSLKLKKIEHLILDEADEMLNMGFIDDVEEIMGHTNSDKRTLLFSATMPKKIKDLARKYMGDYELLKVKKEQLITNLTEQIYFEIKASDKFEALCRIIDIKDDFYGLIFCRTKSDVDFVVSKFLDRGYNAEGIHGDFSQAQRERILGKFKKQKIDILVATDVAARGIDVNNLTHVINYSLPYDPESYVHRIGRTGRAGNQGTAITFVTPNEYRQMMFIQRAAKANIKKSKLPKVEDILRAKRKKIYDELSVIIENKSEIEEKYFNWAEKLLTDKNPVEILSALLKYSFAEELNPNVYGEIKEFRNNRDSSKHQRDSTNYKGKYLDVTGKARLFVALGKKDKMSPKKLVGLITSKVSIKSRQISDVQVMDKFSFITVPFEKAEQIVVNFKVKGSKSLIAYAKNKRR